jgi:hypothetical protein
MIRRQSAAHALPRRFAKVQALFYDDSQLLNLLIETRGHLV